MGIGLIVVFILLIWALIVLLTRPRHIASAGQENLPPEARSKDETDQQRKTG